MTTLAHLSVLAAFSAIFAGTASALACQDTSPVRSERLDFVKEIQPILAENCWSCHGAEVQESRLRLDGRAGMLTGGDSGEPAMIPGDAEQSHFMRRILDQNPSTRMPPDGSEPLDPFQIDLLRTWIAQGADWPGNDPTTGSSFDLTNHWAFRAIARPSPPNLSSEWIRNPIDAFILDSLNQHGLYPNPRTDRAEWIRRLYLDMLGLPPAPEEVQAFSEDHSLQAYDDLIERVLHSPHYGERWARYWLDLVRFAETNGFETNRERPNAWPYRDYVIRSFNDDKPYDQFLREQVAGDALGVPEATAFLVAGPYDLVKSPDINLTMMQRQNELDDMISTTGTAFLGLTVGCARCHNHKFDPIRQSDYYAMQAIFAGVQHGDRSMPLTEELRAELDRLDRKIDELQTKLVPFVQSISDARPAVDSKQNEESFTAQPARSVRFTIFETNSSEPCLDELEVFNGQVNVALASHGSKASSSSNLPGYEIHRLEHVNDGKTGNAHSWISNEPGKGWVQIDFPEVERIDRVVWSRDRLGQFSDRLATGYRIEVAVEPGKWTTIATSDDRIAYAHRSGSALEYDFDRFPQEQAEEGRRCLAELHQCQEQKEKRKAERNVYAGNFVQPGPTHRLFRGEPSSPREEVAPGTIAVLGRLDMDESTSEQQRRLALANWIASKDNPLTARVIVNRLWQFHFGKGLVATPSDFGLAGVKPTHPELVDWLAAELMENGWSLRHIHRLILQSSTYQQSNAPRADGLRIDSANDWCWRFTPRRLEAEPIRDCILAVTGALDRTQFGPGFSAFEVELENVRHYFPKKQYGPADWRRMIYMTKVRMEKESIFGIFDCPDASTSVPRRSRSTTPLQALNLFNSSFMLQQSQLLADRLKQEGLEDRKSQIDRAWRLCYGRAPLPSEQAAADEFMQVEGLVALCRALLNSNEFVFIP